MMNLHAHVGHAITASATIVELDFLDSSTADGPRFSMLLALPKSLRDEVAFEEVAAVSTTVRGPRGDLRRPDVILSLPRFTIAREFQLITTLDAMGMLDMSRVGSADFSKITDGEALWLDVVTHRAVMDVDEEGATAAAATMIASSALDASAPPPLVVWFNRPFLFLLRENRSGLVLFTGWVEDPSLLA
jgi:serpin B